MSTAFGFVGVLLGGFVLGCTYYTNCPKEGCPDDPASTGGGGNGSGGSGASSAGVTGKPPDGTWVNVTANLAGTESGCGDLQLISAKPDQDALIAGVASVGLWISRDGGQSWDPLGTGDGSAAIDNRPTSVVYDAEEPDVFWEAGSYGGGVFRTRDGGETFERLGTIVHTDTVSVDLTDPERNTLLAGAHEQGHKLFKSSDGGESWTDIGQNIASDVNACSFPLVLGTDEYLLACSKWGEGVGGIFHTSDGGDTWDRKSDVSAFSEALVASDGSIYFGGEAGDLQRSDDQGTTWHRVISGIQDRIRPVELPDGRIATLAPRYVIATADRGATWHPVTAELPASDPTGLAYSSFQRAFFVWYAGCEASVRADAIQRFDSD